MRTLLIALQGLRGAPIRSILVVAALTLGMLGFVAVLSAQQVMRETISQRALLTGGPETTLSVTIQGLGTAPEVGRVLEQVKRRTGAASASALVEDTHTTIWTEGHQEERSRVTFVTPSYRQIHPFPIIDGDWLSPTSTLSPRVVINEPAVQLLAHATHPQLGTTEYREPITVIGVVRDGEDDPHVYVMFDRYFQFWTHDLILNIELSSPSLDQDVVKGAIKHLNGLGAPIELMDIHRTDRLSSLAAELGTSSQVLLILAVLGLASTVIGILNVGLSTARARSKEFTLRRTMGASRAQVAAVVLVESQLLAVGAAIIAFGGSFMLFPMVVGTFGAQIGVEPPGYRASYGLVSLVIASAAAASSSIIPALLSYRRDLSSVMRE
ncbi:FtsX-like permease family protein [Microbacterium protaetiae]|uniref:FtsX-like permease family protein n=1 Tax=Microbacterium protaetiae TaxID=2509458 RepID=A0A4P6EP21_9MICO|nr:ABC transporter permease [Microbacterium protaetiae]QAY59678.1 FtsX-like permease family protein [Microbacterium protaetiae]